MNHTESPSVSRLDLAAWAISAAVLVLVIELRLLPSLLAGLLVFQLVDVLTPWLRVTALGRDGPRLLAVTQIGRASCRERVCQYVWISVFAVYQKKTI